MKRRTLLKGAAASAALAPILATSTQALAPSALAPVPSAQGSFLTTDLLADIAGKVMQESQFIRAGIVKARYCKPLQSTHVYGSADGERYRGAIRVKHDPEKKLYLASIVMNRSQMRLGNNGSSGLPNLLDYTGGFNHEVMAYRIGCNAAAAFHTAFVSVCNGIVNSGVLGVKPFKANKYRIMSANVPYQGSDHPELAMAMTYDTFMYLMPKIESGVHEWDLGFGTIGMVPIVVDSRLSMPDGANIWVFPRSFSGVEIIDQEVPLEYWYSPKDGSGTIVHSYTWNLNTYPWHFSGIIDGDVTNAELSMGHRWHGAYSSQNGLMLGRLDLQSIA